MIKKLCFVAVSVLMLAITTYADKGGKKTKKEKSDQSVDSATTALFHELVFRDSVVKNMKYQTGVINLEGGFAKLNIPPGFKFLDRQQAEFIITRAWGNPPQTGILGMILPEKNDPYTDSSYAFIVSFDDMGYVKDGDAADLNYNDMLKDIQKEEAEANRDRAMRGYESIHIVGWAQEPFYDKKRNVLHWAKQIKFGDAEWNTLNYDVRILGRKGVLSLNAVASIRELGMVKKDIDKVLNMAEFTDGNRYADYSSGTDKLAVYTIGGLVAGKVLAKVGFFALLLKFGKFIIIGIVALFAALKRFVFGRKKEEEYVYTPTPPDSSEENNS
jgi:uncharacterized membrane-anchored protein